MLLTNCSANDTAKIVIVTDYGVIELQLYDNTPLHRDNFLKLVNEGVYDGTLFHRIIKNFMIQGGDPRTKDVKAGERQDDLNYTIPAEIVPEYFHKRGALAAARTNNPEKASSATQFYIVQGEIFTDVMLDRVEEQFAEGRARDMYYQYRQEEEAAMQSAGQTVDPNLAHTRAEQRASAYLRENPYNMKAEDRETYKTIGGSPHLDGDYTVFGEVIKGMDVVDKIAALETDDNGRPKVDVRIKSVRVK